MAQALSPSDGRDDRSTHVLTFEENEHGSDPVADLDGKRVFPDEEEGSQIDAGETWVCRLKHRETVAFAEAIRPVTEDAFLAHLYQNPEALEQLLESPKGRHFRQRVERWAKAYIRREVSDRFARQETRIQELANQVEELQEHLAEGTVRARGTQTFGPDKPTLEPGESPDDEFIARKILHQLYTGDYWGGRHTSIKEFQKGQLHGTEGSRIKRVVATLASSGFLIRHDKSPDERYSLNTGRAGRIREILDVTDPTDASGDGMSDHSMDGGSR